MIKWTGTMHPWFHLMLPTLTHRSHFLCVSQSSRLPTISRSMKHLQRAFASQTSGWPVVFTSAHCQSRHLPTCRRPNNLGQTFRLLTPWRCFATQTHRHTYYDVLEVPTSATRADIKAAYRKQALIYHPDHNQDAPQNAETKFRAVVEAYECLESKKTRLRYDYSIGVRIRPSRVAAPSGRSRVVSGFDEKYMKTAGKGEVLDQYRGQLFSNVVLVVLIFQAAYWGTKWLLGGMTETSGADRANSKVVRARGIVARWKERQQKHQEVLNIHRELYGSAQNSNTTATGGNTAGMTDDFCFPPKFGGSWGTVFRRV